MENSTDWWDIFEDEEEPTPEDELGDPCDGCGEREDPRHPNSGDGWAEMAGPGYEDDHFTGHYMCGRARRLELA